MYKQFAAGLIVSVGTFDDECFEELPSRRDAFLMENALKFGCQLDNVSKIMDPTLETAQTGITQFLAVSGMVSL